MSQVRARRNRNPWRSLLSAIYGYRNSGLRAGNFVEQGNMVHDKKVSPPKIDLEAEALIALEQARRMKPGVERTEAMKRAGILRNAADLQGLFFAKRGRPAKS